MAASRLRTLAKGVVLHRIHRRLHDPIFFGPPGSLPEQRYDDPAGVFKTMCLARALTTSFGETLVRLPEIPFVLATDVLVRARSELVTTKALKLHPLIDAGVSAHGLSFTDLHGAAYDRTWAISAEIHAAGSADGILYTSRFDNQPCIALFDRARDAIAETAVKALPLTPELATRLAEHFGKIYVEP